MSGAGFGTALIAFAVLFPQLPLPRAPQYLETQLCATGRILRIQLPPGQNEPDPHPPMPCHAVCARAEDPVKRKKA